MTAQTTAQTATDGGPSFQPGPLTSIADAMAAVTQLLPEVEANASSTDKSRQVSSDIIVAMSDSGLLGIMGARSFGGSEIGVEGLVKSTMEIAAACGSTGWVFGVLAGHSWMVNLFPPQAQVEVAGSKNRLTATVFRMGGDMAVCDGGTRLTDGSGRFCSGIDHVGWVIIGSSVDSTDGKKTEQRFFLVPREDVEIIDDWHTLGMRGTGSKSIRIADAFIPEHRSVAVSAMAEGTSPGALFHDRPLYRMTFADVVPFSIVGAPLGMARAAMRMFADGLKRTMDGSPGGSSGYRDTVLLRLAKATADVDAAIQLVLTTAARVDASNSHADFSRIDRAGISRNLSWSVQRCREAVNKLYESSGGSAIYSSSSMQRIWRDINSAAQHFAFFEDKAMIDYALALLGQEEKAFTIQRANASRG